MKKEIAEAWIASLRDPEARQCTSFLERDDGSQCCLGRLCRIMGVEGVPSKYHYTIISFDEQTISLPVSVMNEAGMRTGFGRIAALKTSLSALNDEGKTFPEIADIIEEHWESL